MKNIQIIIIFLFNNILSTLPEIITSQNCKLNLQFKFANFAIKQIAEEKKTIAQFNFELNEQLFITKHNKSIQLQQHNEKQLYEQEIKKLNINKQTDTIKYSSINLLIKNYDYFSAQKNWKQQKLFKYDLEEIQQNSQTNFHIKGNYEFDQIDCDLKLPVFRVEVFLPLVKQFTTFEFRELKYKNLYDIDLNLIISLNRLSKQHLNYNEKEFRNYLIKSKQYFQKFHNFDKIKNLTFLKPIN